MQTALDDMIAIEILDQPDNIGLKRAHNKMHLTRSSQAFDHLLDCSCAVHVLGYHYKFRRHHLNNKELLLFIAVLNQLLAQIIPKRVRHQFDHVMVDLIKDDVHCFKGVFLLL